jgi:hypothetical protein
VEYRQETAREPRRTPTRDSGQHRIDLASGEVLRKCMHTIVKAKVIDVTCQKEPGRKPTLMQSIAWAEKSTA